MPIFGHIATMQLWRPACEAIDMLCVCLDHYNALVLVFNVIQIHAPQIHYHRAISILLGCL